MTLRLATFCLTLLVALSATGRATARPSDKKAIWGPVTRNGVSQFPIYRRLGAGILEYSIAWSTVAARRPATPRNPRDPAYAWPSELDRALAEGRRSGIRVMVQISRAPRWANGGRSSSWAPRRVSDWTDFVEACARRYPRVHLWMIWGEPSNAGNFQPMARVRHGDSATRARRRGPELYARLLDASYAHLKRLSRLNLVIGGNTYNPGGRVPPLDFVRLLRLPGGRRPRLDLWGHNPVTVRRPDLRQPPSGNGLADFGDLDTLMRVLDRNRFRDGRGRRLRLFLSEFSFPTDHPSREYNFWVDRRLAARWLSDALRVTRRTPRIFSLGWLSLYDDPPNRRNDQVERGLLQYDGALKPAFRAYARG